MRCGLLGDRRWNARPARGVTAHDEKNLPANAVHRSLPTSHGVDAYSVAMVRKRVGPLDRRHLAREVQFPNNGSGGPMKVLTLLSPALLLGLGLAACRNATPQPGGGTPNSEA